MRIVRFLTRAGKAVCGIQEQDDSHARLLEGDIFGSVEVTGRREYISRLLAPVVPVNIFALGLNYGKHADETGLARPDFPIVFLKSTNALLDPGAPILLPKAGPDEVDYEAELAIIIGKQGRNIAPEDAMGHILGYACANDVSARDWQIKKQKGQWARGKSFDTFCPLGPCIATPEEILDVQKLGIRSRLNGKLMQSSQIKDMIFSVPEIVSMLSSSTTLFPGTVILTGTPEGVGFVRKPPVFLRPGDTITVEIDCLGALSNPVELEK